MAIALPTMHRLGAVIAMALAIAMVPQGGWETTTIAMTKTTTRTTTMASNVVGEQGGRLVSEAVSMLKLKNCNDDGIVLDGSLLEDVVVGIGAGAMDGNSLAVGMSNDDD